MTIATIRERLHDYISTADDKKLEAMYTLLEEQISPPAAWYNDKDFVAELDERYERLESGLDKGVSLEELEASIAKMKSKRAS